MVIELDAVDAPKYTLFVLCTGFKCCLGHKTGQKCSWDGRFSGKSCSVTLIFSNFVNSDELERYLYTYI